MAVNENSGTMKYKDGSGNINVLYPITKAANVEGLDDALAAAKDILWATFDSTYKEVKAAYDAGKTVKFLFQNGGSSTPFELQHLDEDGVLWFRGVTPRTGYVESDAVFKLERLKLKPNGSWTAPNSVNFLSETEIDTKLAKKAGTSVASASANGLMSSTDKSKLDGIATGANKTTVDSAMSTTSTNPVQNKVVKAAIDSAIKSAIQNTWEASY